MPDTAPSSLRDPTAAVMTEVRLTVNGRTHALSLDTRTSLLDALREHLHLTGSKKGCDHGQCGACTILVDGRRINACLSLAVMHQDQPIITVEGLPNLLNLPEGALHPMQEAFIAHDAFQCGYCTPGQICSAVGVLSEIRDGVPSHVMTDVAAEPTVTDAELRERMSGNLCRCGAYIHIIEAVSAAAAKGV